MRVVKCVTLDFAKFGLHPIRTLTNREFCILGPDGEWWFRTDLP